MNDAADIWQRYDAKVLQIQQLEARVAELEREALKGKHERDHWARVARQLSKKLQVARELAERLRAAQHEPTPRPERREPAAIEVEFDRAREVLGLVLSALSRALDDDDEAVAELGRRLRHHAGGKLLVSITRGSLTLVPVDGRYLVDREWLERLDLAALRAELELSTQSGLFPLPEELGGRFAGLTPPTLAASGEVEVDVEDDELDAYGEDSGDLPPPPPMPESQRMPPPPLLAALPAEDAPPRPPEPPPIEQPRGLDDTLRAKIQTPAALTEAFIPNLRINRLIKSPSGG